MSQATVEPCLDCTNPISNYGILLWLMWGLTALTIFFQFMLQTSLSVMTGAIAKDFQIGLTQIGLLSSSYYYTYIIFQIPSGLLIDRYGARKLLSVSLILGALCCFWFSYSTSVWSAQLSRLILGAVLAPNVVACLYYSSKYFSPAKFALMAGLAESIGMAGGALGEEILGYTVAHSGWRPTVFYCGIGGLILGLCIWLFVRENKNHKNYQIPQTSSSAAQQSQSILKSVLSNPQSWYVGIYGGLMFVVMTAFTSLWAVPFLMDNYHLSLELSAFISSMTFWGVVLANPFNGWLTDKLGRRKPPMMLGALTSVLIMSALVYIPNWPVSLLFLGFLLVGCTTSCYILSFSFMRDISSDHARGTAMGFVNTMCMIVGSIFLQPLVGWILELSVDTGSGLTHGYKVNMFPIIICLLLGFLITFALKETFCKEQ